MVKKIMIGCPVRNRAWILPRYLKSISDLEYPSEYLCYCFVINDCIDSTPNLLADFARERPGQVKIIVQNLGRRQSKRILSFCSSSPASQYPLVGFSEVRLRLSVLRR